MTTGDRDLGIYILPVLGAVALVVFSAILLLGLAVVGGIAGGLDTSGDPFNTTASPGPVTGEPVGFADTWGGAEVLEVYQVRDTTNTSVNLTGASDSFVESRESFTIAADETWSVCTWARVDADAASSDMTALSANGRVLLQYYGSQNRWSAWYYDAGSTNSWRVNVSAPNQPGNFSHVCATHNATHLTIYRNTTAGGSVNTSAGSNVAAVGASSDNWDGRLDETRTFDTALNASQRQALVSDPIQPLTNATRTARLTYDEGSGAVTAVYFTDTVADVSNATWADGLNGAVLAESTDYTISLGDGSITALDGGQIDGAPVVWIDYRYEPLNRVGQVAEAIAPAYELAASAGLAIPAVVIIALLLGGLLTAVTIVSRTDHSDIDFLGRDRGNR